MWNESLSRLKERKKINSTILLREAFEATKWPNGKIMEENSSRLKNVERTQQKSKLRDTIENRKVSSPGCNIRPKEERRGAATWRATRERVVPVSSMQSANHPAAIQPVGQPRSRESQRRVRRPSERQSTVGARRGTTCTTRIRGSSPRDRSRSSCK